MRKIFEIVGEITVDVFYNIVYFFQVNMRYFAGFISTMVPYLMYVLGQELALQRMRFAVGGEIFIPVAISIVVYYLRQYANKRGRGNAIPVPTKRFTEVDKDTGEVTVEIARTEELLLYVADLEDYLERRRML